MMKTHRREALASLQRSLAALAFLMLVGSCSHQDEPKVTTPETKTEASPPPVTPSHSSLAGTSWLAEDIGGADVIVNVQSTLLFDTAERVAGSGGCNRYFGTVAIADTAIHFSALGATRRACPPALMDQEQKFFTALTATRTYRYEEPGHKLVLLDASGTPLVRFGALKP